MSRIRRYLYDIQTLPRDAALAYRSEGLAGVWTAVATRSLHRLIQTGKVVVFAHALDREVELRLPPGVRITRARDADWAALASIIGQRDLSRFRALHAGGLHCLIAWREDRPVGYAWVADGVGPGITMWPLPFPFPSSAAYLWNLYVIPAERSSGIGSALAAARLRLARERGFQEGWRMVAPSNRASLRTVQKSAPGVRVVGELRFVQLLSRAYAWFTPHSAGTQN